MIQDDGAVGSRSELDAALEMAVDAGPLAEGDQHPIEAAPLGREVTLDVLARRLPKAELHLHFEGAIRPSTLRRLASEHTVVLPGDPARPDALYDYIGFTKFIADMRRASSVLVSPTVIEEAALDVLAAEVDSGARHVELMTTLAYHAERGLDPDEVLDALGSAFSRAARWWDLSGGVIVEMDRPAGAGAALDTARQAVAAAERGVPVLGIGNDGDPLTVPLVDLAPAYALARDAGLRSCGHVDMPNDVPGALELGLDRIDHGFSAIMLPEELARIVEAQVPLTLCVTSNIVQGPGLMPDFDAHPIGALIAAGAFTTLNGDDPPMFFTDLAQEYRAVARALAWEPAEIGAAARRSLDAAWLEPSTRDARLAAWQDQIDALVGDARRGAPMPRTAT
jgi:adenosine deaminase